MNEQFPVNEWDAAFGNALNNMMIAMERDFMEREVNFEFQELADENRQEIVDFQWHEMVESLHGEWLASMHASHSYDLDCIHYSY